MQRRECFELLAQLRTNELAVVNLGMSCYDWYDVTHSDDSFYQWSGLGQASSFGLGLALALPHRGVWILDGDGSLAINLGTLLTTAQAAPPNLTHFLLFNREWGSCGGHDLVAADMVDFPAMARGAGIKQVYAFQDIGTLRSELPAVLSTSGHKFVVLEIEKGYGTEMAFRYDPVEMKYRFIRTIEQQEGLQLLEPWVKGHEKPPLAVPGGARA
jgi:thiamine pyrophosphate-dependent acetolactate synthase large subunit-like protein